MHSLRHIGMAALLACSVARSLAQSTPPAPDTRLPVRGGAIVVKVPGYEAARQAMTAAAEQQGAALLDARTLVNEKGRKSGWMRFSVGADRLPALLAAARSAGKLYSEKQTTDDRTSEHEELARRVRRLREHEQRLDTLINSSRRLRGSDILFVQDRLFRDALDEETMEQRQLDLERAARVSTVIVDLFEPGAVPSTLGPQRDVRGWFARGMERARGDMVGGVGKAAAAGAYALVFAPVWAPAAIIVALLARWLWKRGRVWAARLAAWARAVAARLSRLLPPVPPVPPVAPPGAA